MATFFKKINDEQQVIQIISYDNIVPTVTNTNMFQITEEEYNQYISEFQEKALLTDKLYKNEIKISDIPLDWQGQIQANVDKIISEIGLFEEQEVSSEEFQTMLEEVL